MRIGWLNPFACAQQAQSRRRIGRAAADTGRNRQPLVEREPAVEGSAGQIGEGARGAQDEIVTLARQRAGERTGDAEARRVG